MAIPDSDTMNPTLFACLCLSLASPLLRAERSMEEWSDELGKRYNALGSFRAIYTAVSPTAKEPMQGLVLEDRDSGACLVRMHSDATGGVTMWWLPDGAGNGGDTFAQFGQNTFRVRGFAELKRRYDDLAFLGQKRPARSRRPVLVPVIHLGEETIAVFLAAIRANQSPPFAHIAPSRVAEVRELAETVEFVLDDGSWLRLQRETGLLAGQGYPDEKGERSLLLEAVQPLGNMAEFRKEIPEIDPATLQEASAEDLHFANVLHAALFHIFVNWKEAEADRLLAENPGSLQAYWQAAWGTRPPPGIPADLIKVLQDLKGQKKQFRLEWEAAKKARPDIMKDVSFFQFFRHRRMEFRRDLRQKIEMEAQKLPSLARLQTLLDGEIANLNPDQLPRGRRLAALLVQSQRDAMVIALMPPVSDEDLDKL
ncbi:MAG: hypothetical protein VYA27_11500 [Verrucomicrobiota bacterium]|nr:hypothetical protein [Verrucomicrobiota bacterium]